MSTETKTTIENDVKQAGQKKEATRTVPVTLEADQSAVIVNSDTMAIVDKMYTTQDDVANESKYIRTFMHGAVLAAAKQECRRLQGIWKNAIHKESDLHPTWTAEKCELELLQSKKMQNLKAQVDVALSLLKTEFK